MKTVKETNINILEQAILKLNYQVGVIDKNINSITQKALKEIIDNIDEEHIDLFITIRKQLYVVEIATIDMIEKDINIYNAFKYFAKYGNLEDSFDNGDITEQQYNYYVKMGL